MVRAFKCNLNGYIVVKLDDKLRIKLSFWRNSDMLENIERALEHGIWVDAIVLEPEVAEQLSNYIQDLIDIKAAERAMDEPSVSLDDLKKELGL